MFWQGQVVGAVRKYSDTLLIFLLKSRRPEIYRERAEVAFRTPPVDPASLSDEELDVIHAIIARHRHGQPASGPGTAH